MLNQCDCNSTGGCEKCREYQQKYYYNGKFCWVVRWYGDMAMLRYHDGTVSMGDVHKDLLIKVK